nr:transcription initiation factor IIB [uncultured Methanobrevibacter sp.]
MSTETTTFNRQYSQSDIFHNEEVESCPVCGSTEREVDNSRAEVSCARCGLVFEESLIDNGPEWRAFDHEQRNKRTRTGAPLSFAISDRGLTTTIDSRNKDINGRNIPERSRAQLYRMRKWNKRIRVANASERNLAFALSELDRKSSNLGIPRSIREDAALIYRTAARKKLIRGRSIEGMVAASIYTACRRNNIPRTLDEVAEIFKVAKKQIGKNYRFLSKKLNIKLKPTSPADYVPRFASQLELSGRVESKAIEIINEAKNKGLLNGKGPTGVAATALYVASILMGERKTQRDIAEIAGVTEVTIRNRYKELLEKMDNVQI